VEGRAEKGGEKADYFILPPRSLAALAFSFRT